MGCQKKHKKTKKKQPQNLGRRSIFFLQKSRYNRCKTGFAQFGKHELSAAPRFEGSHAEGVEHRPSPNRSQQTSHQDGKAPSSESWLQHGCLLNYSPVFIDGEIVILRLVQAFLDPLIQVFKSDEILGLLLDRQKGESKNEIKAKGTRERAVKVYASCSASRDIKRRPKKMYLIAGITIHSLGGLPPPPKKNTNPTHKL